MKLGFWSVFVLFSRPESTLSWTAQDGFITSRRQLLNVAAGFSSFGLMIAPAIAEDGVISPVEVAASGDATKARDVVSLSSVERSNNLQCLTRFLLHGLFSFSTRHEH